MTLKQVAESLAKELGASHQIFSSYAVNQTPQRVIPLLQLIELYIKVKGEQAFVENYIEENALYRGFLTRTANCTGECAIHYSRQLLASGQI